ncbi:hypothetical protein Acr_14g0006990 [Actinidia rufa]|uniref:Uncharacterized protein n=1 Tax=Actinidia rufa TaxID=165716 RepID=A0A7J0FR62_9ERIC|nr:hypothetical protein Acr_14g0006990 [Actinidia rufa]
MLRLSGFGWDDGSKMVTVDSMDVWESHVKGMLSRPFSYYEDWLVLFVLVLNQLQVTRGLKKKAREAEGIASGLTSIAEPFGNPFEKTNNATTDVSQRIGYDHDLSNARKKVYGDLLRLPLESQARMKAAPLIVHDADKVDLFFRLPEEDKLKWVYLLLGGTYK